MIKYPLPMPKLLNTSPAILVNDEAEYDIAVAFLTTACENDYSVANQPKRNKENRILDDAFPFLVQMCWMPWCGEHVRCWNKGVKHNYYINCEVLE